MFSAIKKIFSKPAPQDMTPTRQIQTQAGQRPMPAKKPAPKAPSYRNFDVF